MPRVSNITVEVVHAMGNVTINVKVKRLNVMRIRIWVARIMNCNIDTDKS